MRISARNRKKCREWIEANVEDGPVRALVEEYWQQPVVLYTGAGVSTCAPVAGKEGQPYGLPTWIPLLQQLSGQPGQDAWPEDPWLAADRAVEWSGGREAFKRKLRGLIGSLHHYRGKGQLNGTFVSNADTLRALAAFCGQIAGRIFNPENRAPRRVHYWTSANPRVHAVLTANYDCFLEAAGSNLYRKSPLKPVTALGSMAASMSRIPVFHIHGYVPHPLYQDERREQTIDELILTKEDYEKHWNPKDVFGTTMAPQIHYLRYFTVLFIGFSFADEYVCTLLRRINQDYLSRAGRTHFALLEEKLVRERGQAFFTDIGITPIPYQKFPEIPTLLGKVYQAGLACDRIIVDKTPEEQVSLPELLVRTHERTPRSYRYSLEGLWKVMQACSNESVNASMARQFETVEG